VQFQQPGQLAPWSKIATGHLTMMAISAIQIRAPKDFAVTLCTQD